MLVSVNGEIVPRQNAKVDALSESVLFGVGLFETMRTFANRKFFRLERHVDRLLQSAAKISVEAGFSHEEICGFARQLAQASDSEIRRIKIVLFHKRLIVVSTAFKPDLSIRCGVFLKSVRQRRALPEIKSTSYLDCLLAHRLARKEHFYDALLIDESSVAYEGSRSNLFWIRDSRLYTKENRVLPGITRAVIVEELFPQVRFESIRLKELTSADEIFITGSIIGIAPVLKIDNSPVGSGSVGNLTKTLMERYDRLTES